MPSNRDDICQVLKKNHQKTATKQKYEKISKKMLAKAKYFQFYIDKTVFFWYIIWEYISMIIF